MSSTEKQTDPCFRQLLLDVEASNLLREALTFGSICKVKPNFYDANEDLKKKYSNVFDQIKRRTESAYIKLLDSFKIPFGPALQRSLRSANVGYHQTKDSPSSSASSSSSSNSSSDEESEVAKTTLRFKDVSIPKVFTPKEIERIEQTPPRSSLKKKKKTMLFSTPDADSATSMTSNPIADVLNAVELLESIRQDGTLEHPFIHVVNQEHPERNRGFDITFVPDIVHRGHTRDMFHVRKTVSVGHVKHWEAFIPSTRCPTLASRAVMIRHPSQDFFVQDTERHHEDNIECEPTKKTQSATEQAIKHDPSRQFEHTLLIFQKGVKLENHIYSDDAVYVKFDVNDMVATIDNDGEELEIMGTALFWRIAVAGGAKLASAGPKKVKKLFKKAAAKSS
jgi:hypothetical protein